jgi:hypothetical protein
MEEQDALDFYKNITQGTKRYEEISLTDSTGRTLAGVKMHPVDKKVLANIIEQLPDEMFDAVDEAEDPEAAEERLEEEGGSLSAVTGDTVDAFEKLCIESLSHPELTPPQMESIVKELNFEVLFELGTEIINMSSEDTGAIRSFQKQG